MTSLLGRRIHIAGKISEDAQLVPQEKVASARQFVSELVKALLKEGATFVVPIDCEPTRPSDGSPLLFDWLILETIRDHHAVLRPAATRRDPRPLIVAVQHHKNKEQIPTDKCPIWDELNDVEDLVYIENAGHWNMASKRMDIQAAQGDVLIVLGGDEGVLYLANLYRDAGKPVIPLNFPIVPPDKGARRLFDLALMRTQTDKFFQLPDRGTEHAAINKINLRENMPTTKKVEEVVRLVGSLRKPIAFAVRLLNDKHDEYQAVDDYFETVVKPVVEGLGYELVTINGRRNEHPFINQEIFENLHRSSVVVVDITGERPNCFIELGYALGRGLPVMVTAKEGTPLPFDTAPVPTCTWTVTTTATQKKQIFREYWEANAQRRRIVEPDPLVP